MKASIKLNQIQKLFEKHGFDLENDNNVAELCDKICNRIRDKARTQETFFDGQIWKNTKDRIDHLKKRILTEE